MDTFLSRMEEKHFNHIYILYHFSELFQKLMHYFKYEGYIEIAQYFSSSIQDSILKDYDFITAVPLHSSKERERGFNQSEVLSLNICRAFGIKQKNILQRNRYTTSQTKLSRSERKANIHDAFDVIENIKNKSVLLIDDVVTTGATLNECARVLKMAGAMIVDIFALATPVDILQQTLESNIL